MNVEISLLVVVASIIARQSGKIDQGGKTHTESSLLLPMLRVRLASSELRAGSKEQDPGSGSGRRVSPDGWRRWPVMYVTCPSSVSAGADRIKHPRAGTPFPKGAGGESAERMGQR